VYFNYGVPAMSFVTLKKQVRKKSSSINRRYREARFFAKAMKSPRHPILVQLVAIRRCNLACAYCNEYDNFSGPVPLEEMIRRIDHLAALGSTAITLTGGEPLLHPELDEIIQRIRGHGIMAGILTNGYLLTADRIERLNRAGLDHLQISVDNVRPDDVSKKSLKVLDKKLVLLAGKAEFGVNINSVLGSEIPNPEDALAIARRVRDLGLTGSVGIIHNHTGRLKPLNDEQRRVYEEIAKLDRHRFNNYALYNSFQRKLIEARPNHWHCRAGSRYLYVCEDGLVHYCSQQRGYPAIPLSQYSERDLEREFDTIKGCEPFCTVTCVHQVAMIDAFRENPRVMLLKAFPERLADGSPAPRPLGVRLLERLFLSSSAGGKRGKSGRLKRIARKAALRALGVK
jgi:MoaA/NifB/PqqE/SkfB family radical SAM enzyme